MAEGKHTSSPEETERKPLMRRLTAIALRECGIIRKSPIYWFCMIVFPLLVMFFFTSMMDTGQPLDMPIGVVDLDNSATTRTLTRRLDAFQTTKVVAHYPCVEDARKAMQRGEIYGFIYFPEKTTEKLLASRQPGISFYYSMTSLTAGALVYRDLKTISSLAQAAVGSSTMSAKGYTTGQIKAFLQPTTIDLHLINNPSTNYNVYLSTMLVPGVIMLFIFLLTPFSLGMELKAHRSKELMAEANGNIVVAIVGKLLPQTLIFLSIMWVYMIYAFHCLGFPHQGGYGVMLLLGLLSVLASQGFGIFAFGLMPSMRMSMSICSLWAVLSFSIVGSAYPTMSMDAPLQSLAWLFPLRHHYMIYQIMLFNGYPMADAWWHIAALIGFAALPLFVLHKLKNALLTYVYIP